MGCHRVPVGLEISDQSLGHSFLANLGGEVQGGRLGVRPNKNLEIFCK